MKCRQIPFNPHPVGTEITVNSDAPPICYTKTRFIFGAGSVLARLFSLPSPTNALI
jgi:hypothetical protein